MSDDVDIMRARLSGLVDPAILDDPAQLALRHAAAVWSCLTEPGDGIAGTLVDALGAVHALTVALTEPGDRDLQDSTLNAARRRWMPRVGGLDDAFERARLSGVRLVTSDDDDWPAGLSDLGAHAPRCLWVRGDVRSIGSERSCVALVGARAATSYGEHVASEFSAALAGDGITVVSGGAYGIDGMAHRAALATGGPTLAFLAGGVDRPYPAGHDDLLRRVAESGGAIAAEVPCGTTPTKWRFLQRNRLIAASTHATVVIEAGWRSGSLNTAGHAAALGRPLGAVPGPVTSAASAGCHRLFREFGAQCVTTPDEVRELIGFDRERGSGSAAAGRTDDRTRLLDALSRRTPRSTEEIARRAGFDPGVAKAMLGVLELEGGVRRHADEWTRI